jgi:hypothetical protein
MFNSKKIKELQTKIEAQNLRISELENKEIVSFGLLREESDQVSNLTRKLNDLLDHLNLVHVTHCQKTEIRKKGKK